MAVSHDGKQWTKPSLGITQFNHSTSNNSTCASVSATHSQSG